MYVDKKKRWCWLGECKCEGLGPVLYLDPIANPNKRGLALASRAGQGQPRPLQAFFCLQVHPCTLRTFPCQTDRQHLAIVGIG
jgi:hypothetical protein